MKDAIFSPCRGRRHCESCTAGYFDGQGEVVRCACECHERPGSRLELFPAAPVQRVQTDLFKGSR